ncbi:hypothetical protein [Streptomyces nogalater]|uniref:Uncharacterized protein n=1 Tax=Streptomyces nogalater TaxID=38314 RepID=A0ABW0WWT2_STRNO
MVAAFADRLAAPESTPLASPAMVAVPKSQQIHSLAGIWRIDQFIGEAPGDAWQRLSCGNGAKRPRIYGWAAARLPASLIFDPDPPPLSCRSGVVDALAAADNSPDDRTDTERAELVQGAKVRYPAAEQ